MGLWKYIWFITRWIKVPGRPIEKPQDYGSDKGNFSRDPLGKKGLEPDTTERPSNIGLAERTSLKKSLQKLKKKKKILNEKEETGLLSEKNIKP